MIHKEDNLFYVMGNKWKAIDSLMEKSSEDRKNCPCLLSNKLPDYPQDLGLQVAKVNDIVVG